MCRAVFDAPLLKLAFPALTALLLSLLVAPPQGLSNSDWNLFLLFWATIAAILWQPFPTAVVVLVSLALGSVSGILTLEQTLKGYSNSVTWIIVAAFLFSRAFIKTQLGRRIALHFIARLGKSSLRLGYALALTDLVLSPVTASNTARTGGIIYPVARSLAAEFGSEPGPSARKIGSYLLFTAFQANVITSAMFLTAMAANGLSIELARATVGVEITWALWLAAAALPGVLSLILVPYLIYRSYPPELTSTPQAQVFAQRELHLMGPMSRDERFLVVIFTLLALTWATSQLHAIHTVAAALAAVSTLLVTGILKISDVGSERPAWETFLWFGGMVSLAGALTDSRLIDWFVTMMKGWFAGVPSLTALILLIILYVYLHYAFASMTAQIIALYAAFLTTAVSAGAPPLLSALLFCFFSNLYASLTHYGDGAAPIYFGSGYIEQGDWWRVGFYISVSSLIIWLGVGLPWLRISGIWE